MISGRVIRKRLNSMVLRWKNDERKLEEMFPGSDRGGDLPHVETLRYLVDAIAQAERALYANDDRLERWSRRG